MKICGTIQIAKDNSPIGLAKIKLEVDGEEIATVFTDENGRYEYKTDEDLIGKDLTYTIEKEGFEQKTYSSVIGADEIQKKFSLREHEILVDRKTPILYFGFGILIVILLVFSVYIFNPQLDYESISDDTPDYNLTLNDKYTYKYTISRPDAFPYNIPVLGNIGSLEWEVLENEEWIYVDSKSGRETGNITVTVFTPDSEFSPGSEYYAKIRLVKKGIVLPPFQNPEIIIPFRIPDKKDKRPKLYADITLSPNPLVVSEGQFEPIEIQIRNENTISGGTLYWSIKDNVTWINLLIEDDENNRGRVKITDYIGIANRPRFDIDFSDLDLAPGESDSARITIQSNNDGKIKIYLTVTRMDSTLYRISHVRTEDWYGPNLVYNAGVNLTGTTANLEV